MKSLVLFAMVLLLPVGSYGQTGNAARPVKPAIGAPADALALTGEESTQLRIANLKLENSNLRVKLLQEQVARLADRAQKDQQAASTEKAALVKEFAAKRGIDTTKQQLDEAKGTFVPVTAPSN